MSEGAAVDYDSMPFDQFADDMYAKMEAAEALLSRDALEQGESGWKDLETTRRAALLTLTKSGPELIQSVTGDRGFAVVCAELLSCTDDYLKKLDSLKELVGHTQWRLMMALAHREDMSAVMEEGKQHHEYGA